MLSTIWWGNRLTSLFMGKQWTAGTAKVSALTNRVAGIARAPFCFNCPPVSPIDPGHDCVRSKGHPMANFPDNSCLVCLASTCLHLREAIQAVTKETRRRPIPVIASMEAETLWRFINTSPAVSHPTSHSALTPISRDFQGGKLVLTSKMLAPLKAPGGTLIDS